MSSASPTRRRRSPLRHRLTTLASAAALSIAGLLAVTSPAHADANIQITDSADPVTVNTPYNYIVTIPNPYFAGGFAFAAVDLSGAAATFTGAITSSDGTLSCSASGTHAQCNTTGPTGTAPITITATVLPTATGTVTANTVLEGMGPIASDSTTTTIDNATPAFPFTGFFSPVNNLPTVNSMNAGRAVPVKFSLGGDKGLNIFNPGYPASQQVNCQSGAPISPIEETVTAGNSSLQYNQATGQYTYVWKTDKAWEGTCRQLTLQLTDGTNHQANFQFN